MAADYEVIIQPDRTLVVEIPTGLTGPQGPIGLTGPTQFMIQFSMSSGENKRFTLLEYVPFAFTIDSVYARTASGTITASMEVDLVAVPGLQGAITTTQSMLSPTDPTTVAQGQRLTAFFTANTAAQSVSYLLMGTRV